MKFFTLLFLLFSIVSCHEEKTIIEPSNLINQKKMIDVIVDVQILESHYSNKHQRPEVFANGLDSATFFLFENHNISKPIFKENLQYYLNLNDKTLFNIYEAALDTINNRINSKNSQ